MHSYMLPRYTYSEDHCECRAFLTSLIVGGQDQEPLSGLQDEDDDDGIPAEPALNFHDLDIGFTQLH